MTQEMIPFKHGEIEKVNDLEKRIVDFLPGGKDIPHDVRMAMAQISIAHGLDPFLREVWPIPKYQDRQIVGYDMFIGISGWRNAAHRSGEYWGRRFEKVSTEERAWLGASPNDLVVKCIVMRRKTGQHAAEFDGYGVAKPEERSKMNKFQLARLRAERDAMKAAFPISAPYGVNITAVADDGEIINGDHGPDLPSLSRYDASAATGEIIDPADVLKKNKKALGRDDGDLTEQPDPIPHFDPLPSGVVVENEALEKTETEPAQETKSDTANWQVAFEGLNLSKPRQDAMLKRFNGDYEAAYKFATKG